MVADVAAVLGYSRTNDAARMVDREDLRTHAVRTNAGPRPHVLVNESGLWAILTGSRRPEAKPVRRWVTSEVLPTIRRTGSYSITQQQAAPAPTAASKTCAR